MKRYLIELTDKFGNTMTELVTPKELDDIKAFNPQLAITVKYTVIGRFSHEE